MTQRPILPLALAFALPLAACQEAAEEPAAPEAPAVVETATPAPAAASFTEEQKLQFTGTEPFWGGDLDGTSLTYTTPENIAGSTIAVERSGVNGVLTLTGAFEGGTFELVVKEGRCSDGMSDRTYPFIATLTLPQEVRNGCAWNEANPFEGPVNP